MIDVAFVEKEANRGHSFCFTIYLIFLISYVVLLFLFPLWNLQQEISQQTQFTTVVFLYPGLPVWNVGTTANLKTDCFFVITAFCEEMIIPKTENGQLWTINLFTQISFVVYWGKLREQ